MIRRLLFLALAVMAVAWWARRVVAAARVHADRATGGGREEPRQVEDLGPMVRDRVCNTFLPKSRALTLSVGSEEHFFCSEDCRREFRSKQTTTTTV